jgi:hypothetical protein
MKTPLVYKTLVMQTPKIPSFFKSKKPDQFYFEPRYYNARKEKMQERYDRIAREVSSEKSSKTDTEVFRSNLRESWAANRSQKTGFNYRILFYIVFLTGLAYYFLFR